VLTAQTTDIVIFISVRGLSDLPLRSYSLTVALIPRGALNSKRTATFAVVVSVIGLAVIPILTIPAMLIAGVGWKSAPTWTRLTLIAGAVLFAAYLVALKPAAPVTHS